MDISISDSVWKISDLRHREFDLLLGVPAAADPGTCDAAQHRLFPPPLRNPSSSESEFLEDWKSYVTEGLATQFSHDLATFSSDLKRAVVTGSDEEGKPVRSLDVPLSHAYQWFSSLNQARLVLADVHQIFDEEGQIRPKENEDFTHFHQRWRYYVQSNYYAAIQEWLVVNVLPHM